MKFFLLPTSSRGRLSGGGGGGVGRKQLQKEMCLAKAGGERKKTFGRRRRKRSARRKHTRFTPPRRLQKKRRRRTNGGGGGEGRQKRNRREKERERPSCWDEGINFLLAGSRERREARDGDGISFSEQTFSHQERRGEGRKESHCPLSAFRRPPRTDRKEREEKFFVDAFSKEVGSMILQMFYNFPTFTILLLPRKRLVC